MTENLLDEQPNHPSGIRQKSFGYQFLVWCGIFLFCFIAAQLISGVIIMSYYKQDSIKAIIADTGNLNTLRFAQMLASLIGFLLPALVFSKLKSDSYCTYSDADKGFPFVFILIVPLMIITFYPLIDASFYLNKLMPWSDWMKDAQLEYKAIVDALLADTSMYVFVLNFITVALLPAIAEEWLFRGTLQKLLSERLSIHVAVLVSSVLFSLVHAEFSGFLPRILLGVFLGYLFYYSGSLWVSIFAHLVNNGAQVILMYLNSLGIYKINLDQPEMPDIMELILYTSGFVVLSIAFYHFSRKNKKSTFV
jgi:uncharacterized protein